AIEVVSDAGAKTPMDAATMKRLHTATYQAGAMVRLGMHNIMMSPPLVITEAEIDAVLAALDAGFAAI
ncbi:MAG: aspartate aminotransferase family protein, partial [Pseudomonadota bacterium]